MTDILNDTETPETPRFEDLVGDGKKFADADALAKAKAESDTFILKLQQETEEMRTELQARLTLEEMMKELPVQQNDQRNDVSQEPVPQTKEPETDIESLVSKALQKQKATETAEKNLETVRDGLKERFGPDYNKTLSDVAERLGIGKDFLTSMAKTSPAGLLALVDSSVPRDNNRPMTPPDSTRDAGKVAIASPTKKNNSYYRELKRTDPKTYFSRKVQAEMHTQAVAQGPSFYQ